MRWSSDKQGFVVACSRCSHLSEEDLNKVGDPRIQQMRKTIYDHKRRGREIAEEDRMRRAAATQEVFEDLRKKCDISLESKP